MKPLVFRKKRRVRQRPVVRVRLAVTKGDTVRVVRGDDKGKEGVVLRVLPKLGKVVVEGVRIVKRHKKATQSGDEGGIIQFAAPIHASNVMLIDPKSGEATRVRRKRNEDGTLERLSAKSGRPIPRKR
jgi:large subunit ribosomal protein L24